SEQLLVDLAGEGIPHSGHIDYSFFSENTSWGVTDNEFNMMKLDAMQTELADMMTSVEGIEDAKVMINLPEESVFVSDVDENASVSIVLDTLAFSSTSLTNTDSSGKLIITFASSIPSTLV